MICANSEKETKNKISIRLVGMNDLFDCLPQIGWNVVTRIHRLTYIEISKHDIMFNEIRSSN